MPPQTFFSGGWAGRKWATDHHRRSLPFKKQHKSKDEIFKCLKGAKSVKSGAEDTGPVTCLQPAILRVKSEKKPHVTSIPSLGFYRKIAKLFSKEKKVQINFSSMFYCILATFSFYFLPSPPPIVIVWGIPQTRSSGLFFIVASISLGVWHSGPFTKPSLSLVPVMPFCHLASLPHSIRHYRKRTFSSIVS